MEKIKQRKELTVMGVLWGGGGGVGVANLTRMLQGGLIESTIFAQCSEGKETAGLSV